MMHVAISRYEYDISTLFSMVDQLREERLRNLSDDQHRQSDDLFSVERWEGAEDFVWTGCDVSKIY